MYKRYQKFIDVAKALEAKPTTTTRMSNAMLNSS